MTMPALRRLDGTALPAAALAGTTVLFVNVASRCGLTPQYTGLEALQERYAARGFTVIGVPCNQFGAQEPGSATEIATFPLLEKQEVNGEGRSALYQWLVGEGPDIQWNFEKFLVDADGVVAFRFSPMVTPDDPGLVAKIEALLPV